jgi:outer membrane lipoprotein-sorting protein
MSLFTDHPRARWAAPVVALAVIGAVALAANRTASADPSLPPRSAAQLLVDVQQAGLKGISGTVVQTSNLGLPDIRIGGSGGGGSSSLSSTISGTHTWRVWYADPQHARLALVGSLGESDVIRNGRDVWVWSSKDKTATHTTVPAHSEKASQAPVPTPNNLPKTPQEAAQMALSAIEPTTTVTTSGASVVAGQSAYDLVLKPKDAASLVAQVRISIDAVHHVPLRVQVYSTKRANPAFEVGFTHVDFGKPSAAQFAFNPPPGTKVTQSTLHADHGPGRSATAAPGKPATKPSVTKPSAAKPSATKPSATKPSADQPKVVGTGWTAVVVARIPSDASQAAPRGKAPDQAGQTMAELQRVLSLLPKTSGAWGSGRVLTGTLFSAVITDDGRVAIGAVAPAALYAALAAK